MLVRAQHWPRRSAGALIRAQFGNPPVVRWVLLASGRAGSDRLLCPARLAARPWLPGDTARVRGTASGLFGRSGRAATVAAAMAAASEAVRTRGRPGRRRSRMLWLSLSVAAGLLVLVPGPRVAARRPSSSDSHPLLLVPRLVRTRRERPRAVPIRLALAIRAAERLRRAWSDDGSPQARAAVSRGLGGRARRFQGLATISLRKSRGPSAGDGR